MEARHQQHTRQQAEQRKGGLTQHIDHKKVERLRECGASAASTRSDPGHACVLVIKMMHRTRATLTAVDDVEVTVVADVASSDAGASTNMAADRASSQVIAFIKAVLEAN